MQPFDAGLLAARWKPRRGRADERCGSGSSLLRNLAVSMTILGAVSIEELRTDLGALSVRLHDTVVERLDQISPRRGEAPEAYDW